MQNPHCMVPVIKSPKDYKAYRILPDASNRLVIVFDPNSSDASLTYCIEIFDVGGKSPPNRHGYATEIFFILKGEGKVYCDGKVSILNSGDSCLVPATSIHAIENTGSTRLYALCVMVPNEDFAELIYSGVPVELDQEDLAVLFRLE